MRKGFWDRAIRGKETVPSGEMTQQQNRPRSNLQKRAKVPAIVDVESVLNEGNFILLLSRHSNNDVLYLNLIHKFLTLLKNLYATIKYPKQKAEYH